MGRVNYPIIRSLTVTTTTQQILNGNRNRKAVLIFNNGTVTVYLLSNKNQGISDGIPIKAGSKYDNDHFNPQGEYWIIAASGTPDVRIEEDISRADS